MKEERITWRHNVHASKTSLHFVIAVGLDWDLKYRGYCLMGSDSDSDFGPDSGSDYGSESAPVRIWV